MDRTAGLAEALGTRYLGPARVVSACEGERVFVTLDGQGGPVGAWARVALTGPSLLAQDDEVLVTGDEGAGYFVIGVLGARPAESGPVATGRHGLDLLRSEYDPRTDTARITVRAANLEFAAPAGGISFVSGTGIAIDGDTVRLDARSSVSLRGEEVRVSGERGAIALRQAAYTGDALLANVGRVRWFADRLETTATTVVEAAKNVYRTVEQLSQVKAGRVRMLVASTFRLKAKHAVVKADEDCKITADRIDLG